MPEIATMASFAGPRGRAPETLNVKEGEINLLICFEIKISGTHKDIFYK